VSVATAGLLGIAIGLRHAFEPDHLAAVSTLVADGAGARRGALLGALWGLGHAIALLAMAAILGAVGTTLPDDVGAALELAVAAMLIALGVRAVIRAARCPTTGAAVDHVHGDRVHRHGGAAAHVHVGGATLAIRPLVVGMIHGLAGGGALAVVVASRLPSFGAQLAWVGLFGLGALAGMAVVSAVGGAAIAATSARAQRRILIGLGASSVVIGVVWGALSLFG
jgi:high-affinity nickel-transport protein